VALVAYAAKDSAGQRLIDQPMLNATVLLVIVTSVLGLVLAERAARQVRSMANGAAPALPVVIEPQENFPDVTGNEHHVCCPPQREGYSARRDAACGRGSR